MIGCLWRRDIPKNSIAAAAFRSLGYPRVIDAKSDHADHAEAGSVSG
jgi:hypothetical protein